MGSGTFSFAGAGALLVLACLAGCSDSATESAARVPASPTLVMNPYGVAPLTGVVQATTFTESQATLEVRGGGESWHQMIPGYRTDHALPVVGLKPATRYSVRVRMTDAAGDTQFLQPVLQVTTPPLPADFPVIQVLTRDPARMEPGWTLLERSTRGVGRGVGYTIIIDDAATVRWYSPLGGAATRQRADGRLRYLSARGVIDLELTGRRVSRLFSGQNQLNHDQFPTQHGTTLTLGKEVETVAGYPLSEVNPALTGEAQITHAPILEFDESGALLGRWSMASLLSPTRTGYGSLIVDQASGAYDWAHVNAVFHDPVDDSIMVSIRHQDAVVKFDRATGQLRWILGNHVNWPASLAAYLLNPVGTPFEWQYHQHEPILTRRGTVLLMDNGNWRASPFDGRRRLNPAQNYSRAVEYAIDEPARQVRQVWEYGAQLGERIFSIAMGGVQELPVTDNVLITFGAVTHTGGVGSVDLGRGRQHTRVVEVTHDLPASPVFDIAVYDPAPEGEVNTYRSHRIPPLY